MSVQADSLKHLRSPANVWDGRQLTLWWLQRSFEPLFSIYVYLLILLPSGSIFHVNVKIICFALMLPGALFTFVENRQTMLLHVCLVAATPILFAVWIFISQLYAFDISLSFSQYKDVSTTLASCWLAAIYCSSREGARLRFLNLVLYAETVTCILKVALLVYCFYKGILVSVMVNQISELFGATLSGMDFESALGRIQLIADGLIPICIYMLLRYRQKLRIGTGSALVMFVLLVISLVFTFSRYFWAFAALAFVLGFLFGKKDRFHTSVLVLLGLLLAVSLPAVVSLYQLRFSAAIAGESDSARIEQIPALEHFFLDAPFFGHGFGSYTPEVIRSDELPYAYEVQLYALCGQVGLVGLLLFAALAVYYFRPLWRDTATLGRGGSLGLLLLLLAWLAAGLYNPMLLNSAAAMSYAVLRELAGLCEKPAAGALQMH